jgi:hypothetical protein
MPPLPGTFDTGPGPDWDPSQGISLSAVEKGGPLLPKPASQVPHHIKQPFESHAVPEPQWQPSQEPPANKRLRPLTVNEALPYSPFASIVPFDPGGKTLRCLKIRANS